MQTTLLNGFTGNRNEIEARERQLRDTLAAWPQCFKQLVKLCNGQECMLAGARKLQELGLLDADTFLTAAGRPNLASVNPIDLAIILSAVKIDNSGLTFGSPYKAKAGRRSKLTLAASNTPVTIAAGGSEIARAATA